MRHISVSPAPAKQRESSKVWESLVRVYHPHIAALLVAVAQERYEGHENHVTVSHLYFSRGLRSATDAQKASVVFSKDPTMFSKDPVSEFLVYIAKIPAALL